MQHHKYLLMGNPVNTKTIARDVLIIFGLTFLSGFIVGLSGALNGEMYLVAIAAGNLLVSVMGFTISGALARTDRFKHLLKVALGLWFLNLVNVLFVGVTLTQWVLSIAVIFVAMGIGGLLSFLFVKNPKLDY
jgi:hypothetical protein